MKTATIAVSGMTCGACVGHVTQALKSVDGVTDAVVSLVENRATVTFDEDKTSESALVAAVEEDGYGASL